MPLTSIEESLLVAAFYRGGSQTDRVPRSNSDQIVTLSLFYTGDITADDCAARFSTRRYLGQLYDDHGVLTETIANRYWILLELVEKNPDLIEGFGNLETPADPTYTSCRLTSAGQQLALSLIKSFPRKPEFPNWPDKRSAPDP